MMCIFCGVFRNHLCVQIVLVEDSISKCVVTGGTVQVSGLICVEGCKVHEQYNIESIYTYDWFYPLVTKPKTLTVGDETENRSAPGCTLTCDPRT